MKRGKFIKEIYLGHGLYKRIYEDAWLKADLEKGVMSDNTGKTFSQQLQDELEPIFHPTQHDESDDIEESKKEEGKLTEFEKSEIKRKIKKRSVWGSDEWHFFKGEKWEWKNDT